MMAWRWGRAARPRAGDGGAGICTDGMGSCAGTSRTEAVRSVRDRKREASKSVPSQAGLGSATTTILRKPAIGRFSEYHPISMPLA